MNWMSSDSDKKISAAAGEKPAGDCAEAEADADAETGASLLLSAEQVEEFCEDKPNQAFHYWRSCEADLKDAPNMGRDNERKTKAMLRAFEAWFSELGHWRELDPKNEDLSPDDHVARNKAKGEIDAYVASRQEKLSVVEYDSVVPEHRCEHEGTEHERVYYQWAFCRDGEPQVILYVETTCELPPHNDSMKRLYFKHAVPCAYAVSEVGGTVYFENGESIPFDCGFDGEVYPPQKFHPGDYELKRIPAQHGAAPQPNQEDGQKGAQMASRSSREKKPRKRASRAATIDAIKNLLRMHLRAARDNAYSSLNRDGDAKLLPRPTQSHLAAQLKVSTSSVCRAIRDDKDTELKVLWQIANDVDQVMRFKG